LDSGKFKERRSPDRPTGGLETAAPCSFHNL
jgi:hypothetical protein